MFWGPAARAMAAARAEATRAEAARRGDLVPPAARAPAPEFNLPPEPLPENHPAADSDATLGPYKHVECNCRRAFGVTGLEKLDKLINTDGIEPLEAARMLWDDRVKGKKRS